MSWTWLETVGLGRDGHPCLQDSVKQATQTWHPVTFKQLLSWWDRPAKCKLSSPCLISANCELPGGREGGREYFVFICVSLEASPVTQQVKNSPAVQEMQEMQFWSLGWEEPLEEGMATHSSILAWRIPRTEEPGGLQFKVLQRVRHDGMLRTESLQYLRDAQRTNLLFF